MAPITSALLRPFAWLGGGVLSVLADQGRWGIFITRSLFGAVSPPYKLAPVVKEARLIGFDSLSIIAFTGFFTGMVLGLQGYHTLKLFSAEAWLGTGVVKGLLRELGPVLSALLLTGRAGSALCAQIGVMRISEQIDAIECMAIDTFNFLISPKLIAGVISLPLLTLIFCGVGVFGGYVASCPILGINPGAFYDGMVSKVERQDIRMCLVKSVCFGFLVITICAYNGYSVMKLKAKGAAGVSHATTRAVVFSSVNILMWDYLLTSVLM